MWKIVRSASVGTLLMCVGACASRPSGPEAWRLDLNAGEYAAAFDAARDELRDQGFILERVDARSGVITTQAKTTAGLATPWHGEQSTARQELEDLLQRQQRLVRITFEPEADGEAPSITGPVRMLTSVTVQRVNTPGFKLEPEAIRQSSFYVDPVLADRRMQPNYAVSLTQDPALAERITRRVESRIRPDASPVREAHPAPAQAPATEEPMSPPPQPAKPEWRRGEPLPVPAPANP